MAFFVTLFKTSDISVALTIFIILEIINILSSVKEVQQFIKWKFVRRDLNSYAKNAPNKLILLHEVISF